ncbi:hypothetical protein C4D60_Mb04t31910 [Musa balbisiana]|uniref:Uncharacterized protein n=1 Tax=Musa balbisiana TaxID=52838 RepID=A0A4S8KG49_MUSBA|nr:hypothetical protein C4D60_Mb04t31910 [Musa balbisiana]
MIGKVAEYSTIPSERGAVVRPFTLLLKTRIPKLAMEEGCSIIKGHLNVGRSIVDAGGLDGRGIDGVDVDHDDQNTIKSIREYPLGEEMCRNCTRHGQRQLLHIVYEDLCHWIRFSSLLLLGIDLPTTHQPSQASLYLIAPSEAHLPL